MGIIKNLNGFKREYENLEFDDFLWEIIDIPKEVYRSWYDLDNQPEDKYLTQTLHYIGPAVGGEIVCKVPAMNFQYHTFAGCKELREIPANFCSAGSWEPFYGCSNLNPSLGKFRTFRQSQNYCSYDHRGYLLDGCDSSHIVSADSQEEFFAKLTGYNLSQFSSLQGWLKQWHSGFRYDIRYFAKVLGAILEQGLPLKESFYVTQGAGIIQIKSLHKASEIPEECWNKEVVMQDFIVACSSSGSIDLCGNDEIFVGMFADDFVNDTMDAEILSVRPQAIHGSIDGSITATEIIFDGDCAVEAEDFPAIVAEGTLTLRGTGNVVLKSHGVQPAVGIETHDGMSYGRWCPGDGILRKVIVDGVHVRLESDVPNFTLGNYGTAFVPEIELLNGGTLDCPEMKGKRVMVQSGEEGLYGSTKRSNPAIYKIEADANSESLDDSSAKPINDESSAKPVNAFL